MPNFWVYSKKNCTKCIYEPSSSVGLSHPSRLPIRYFSSPWLIHTQIRVCSYPCNPGTMPSLRNLYTYGCPTAPYPCNPETIPSLRNLYAYLIATHLRLSSFLHLQGGGQEGDGVVGRLFLPHPHRSPPLEREGVSVSRRIVVIRYTYGRPTAPQCPIVTQSAPTCL